MLTSALDSALGSMMFTCGLAADILFYSFSEYMICEMFSYYATKGISLLDKLEELYKTYGYCLNTLHSYEFDGSAGFAKMQSIMQTFRGGIKEFGAKGSSSCWTTHRVWMVCRNPMCSSSFWKITAPSWCVLPALSRNSRHIFQLVQKIRRLLKKSKQRSAKVQKNI